MEIPCYDDWWRSRGWPPRWLPESDWVQDPEEIELGLSLKICALGVIVVLQGAVTGVPDGVEGFYVVDSWNTLASASQRSESKVDPFRRLELISSDLKKTCISSALKT